MDQKPEHNEPEVSDENVNETYSSYIEEEEQTDIIRGLIEAVRENDSEKANALIEDIHTADLADIFELLDGSNRKGLTHLIRDNFDPELLPELEGQAFNDVISVLDSQEIADAVTSMDIDDAVFILQEMEDDEQQQEVLDNIGDEDRVIIEKAFTYPEESAGRLMRRDFVAVPSFWTVANTIEYLRQSEGLGQNFWEIFIVDAHHHPIGTLPLSWFLRASPDIEMNELMKLEQTLIPVDMDQEEVAFLFRQYHLVSAAVVDEAGRLVGMITVDDIVDVMKQEAGEDILALAGVKEGDLNSSVREIANNRFVWLATNLATAILASIVIAQFGASIEKLVALAILMPIVASMGGNAGTQTMTVVVRALSSKEITPANAKRVIFKEFSVGLINGILFALIMGVLTSLWFQNIQLGLVIGSAMTINLVAAGLSGILVPLGLDRIGVDPAVSSGVFVTTITDVVGFLAFLGLAALFLI